MLCAKETFLTFVIVDGDGCDVLVLIVLALRNDRKMNLRKKKRQR